MFKANSRVNPHIPNWRAAPESRFDPDLLIPTAARGNRQARTSIIEAKSSPTLSARRVKGKPASLALSKQYWVRVRRGKALSSSGCESRPATVAPTGSNRSNRGGNEAVEAFGVEGPSRDLAIVQAVMRMNVEQASKRVYAGADRALTRGRLPLMGKRARRHPSIPPG